MNLDERARKVVVEKKLASLCKQAEELSILCDVKVGVVAFRPGETKAFAWPCLTQANATMNEYLACDETQKQHKLFTQVTYLQRKIDAREEYIRKIEQIAEEKEMENLFNQLVMGKSIHELDAREIKGLLKLFDAHKTKLNERKTKLNEHDVDGSDLNQTDAKESNVGEENGGNP
ncbi:agamous-like MADS-box protein AGL92 [Solanum lycopersicum]|uniref:agamous-like MADS-box protein AGL92 n=1 Tax=Solanum lycopersicum TaxID=4081 RepID=UPI0002BCC365|nr:MADS-box transcription factor 47-like [Solanum lycopersicum]